MPTNWDDYYRKERDASSILVDDTHAIMTAEEFRALPEYSSSLPTGVYFGKRWKRGEPYRGKQVRWYLGEFYEVADPKSAGIKFREIILV